MKKDILFKFIILAIAIIVLSFNVLLYFFCEKQKAQMENLNKQQMAQAQEVSNQFKYQQETIGRMGKDLENTVAQVKDQKETMLQEIEKRQQMEIDNKSIETSLVDIKAEADVIKQQMQGWQKDYVAVLAQLEKKMDNAQDEIKAFEQNLTALNIPELKENINSLKDEIEKMPRSVDNSTSNVDNSVSNETSPDISSLIDNSQAVLQQ